MKDVEPEIMVVVRRRISGMPVTFPPGYNQIKWDIWRKLQDGFEDAVGDVTHNVETALFDYLFDIDVIP